MSNSEKINVYVYTGLPDEKRNEFTSRTKERDSEIIVSEVCSVLSVTVDQLKSNTRKREVVEARFIAMALIMIANPDLTLKEVGAMFNRDHSTVVYARDTYKKLMEGDKAFQDKVALVKQKV
jgi:chromosomal replication initiator protein